MRDWRELRPAWADVAAVAFLAAIAVAFITPALAAGEIVGRYPSDGARLSYFIREYLMASIAEGRLPAWNPFTHFGTPFLANISVGAAYPVNLALAGMPANTAYNLFLMLHLALAGIAMYLLARDWDLGPAPATVAALAFMLNGRLVTFVASGLPHLLATTAWLPMLVLLFSRALDPRRARPVWVALGGLAFGIQVLSGHPQFTFFTAVVMLAVAVWRAGEAYARRSGAAAVTTPLATLVAVLILGCGVAAVQLLPAYEAASLSTRAFDWSVAAPRDAILGSYHPIRLITWVMPDFFGNSVSLPPASTDWLSLALDEVHSNESVLYVGVLPLVLAAFSLTAWRTDRRVPFLWLLAAGSVVMALGHFTPVYGLIDAVVPPLRTFRIPARFLTITAFALALLGGIGTDALLRARRETCARWSGALALLALLLAAGIVAGLALREPILAFGRDTAAPLFSGRPSGVRLGGDARDRLVESAYALSLRGGAVAAMLGLAGAAVFYRAGRGARPRALAAAVLAITAADMAVYAAPYAASESIKVHVAQNGPLMRLMRETGGNLREITLHPHDPSGRPDPVRPNDNVFLHERLLTASGYDTFELQTYSHIRTAIEADLERGSPYLASVFGLGVIVSERPLSADFDRAGTIGPAGIYLNPAATRRVYVARPRAVSDAASALKILQAEGIRPGEEVLVESSSPIHEGHGRPAGVASVTAFTPETLRVRVRATGDAYLVVNDSWYSGWTATVDGRPAPVLRANGHVRAVPVTAGEHDVVMSFDSRAIVTGLRTTGASLLLVALLIAAGGRRRA